MKPQALDISLREPVTHQKYIWPVENKIKVAKLLYQNMKPKEVTGMAVYAVEAAPAFGYPKRECVTEEEIKFIQKFKEIIKTEDKFEVLRNREKNKLQGVYAMTDIIRVTDVDSPTMKIIIENQINCIFLDWFPSKEKLEEENDNYIKEEIKMIENAISSFENAL